MTDIAAGQCQSFVASADGYDRLMGRYLPSLAPAFADAAGVRARAQSPLARALRPSLRTSAGPTSMRSSCCRPPRQRR